jgi:hypothetical protein
MQTDQFSTPEAQEARTKFSHQTLLLTALTALNNGGKSPSFHDKLVFDERIKYMRRKTDTHTSVVDSVTSILITGTEIIATMSHGVKSIVAVKEESSGNDDPDEDEDIAREQPDPNSDKALFLSFPNIDDKLFKPTGSQDFFCKPIAEDVGFWRQINNSNTGYIVDSK